MDFSEFQVGQEFSSSFVPTESDFHGYVASARTKNILHENPELARKEGITGILMPGRYILARAEGEMTRLPRFSENIMLLYGMDGDPGWEGRQTRFLGEVYAGDELRARYFVSGKKIEKGYGILAIDFEVERLRDVKLVVVSRRNLYRIKLRA